MAVAAAATEEVPDAMAVLLLHLLLLATAEVTRRRRRKRALVEEGPSAFTAGCRGPSDPARCVATAFASGDSRAPPPPAVRSGFVGASERWGTVTIGGLAMALPRVSKWITLNPETLNLVTGDYPNCHSDSRPMRKSTIFSSKLSSFDHQFTYRTE
jgi:hypothetical protein